MSLADKLTDGQLDCCIAEFKQRGGFVMTREQVRNMLRGENQRFLCRKLISGYPDATPNSDHGLDTYERHILLDIFAERILGRPAWPMIGEIGTEHHDTFTSAIVNAIHTGKVAGYAN
jgi:hypothetical protein